MTELHRPSQVAAARLVRQALKQQGRPSPDWINLLAAEPITRRTVPAVPGDAGREPRNPTEAAISSASHEPAFETRAGQTSEPQQTPDHVKVDREQLGYLHDAIAELPVRLRYVVQASFFDSRDLADIAVELGVTEPQIAQLRAAALRLLRDGLAVSRDNSHSAPEAVRSDDSVVISYAAAVAARRSLRARLGEEALSSELVDPGNQHAARLLSILR